MGGPRGWAPRPITGPYGGAGPFAFKGPGLSGYNKGDQLNSDLLFCKRAPTGAHAGLEVPPRPPVELSGQGGPRYPYSLENYRNHRRDLKLSVFERRASANYYKHDVYPSETSLRAYPNSFSRELDFYLESPKPPVEVPKFTTQ